MTESWWRLLDLVNAVVLAYFALLNSFYLVTTLAAFTALRVYARRLEALDIEDLFLAAGIPAVTIIVPTHNEELNTVEVTTSLLQLNYPEYEVIVVNDGSEDLTLSRLSGAFDLVPVPRAPTATIPTAEVCGQFQSRRYPHLWVIDKENGGKADAINVGLNVCRTPLFCVVDSDCLLERDSLMHVVRPFLTYRSTVACGGVIRIANGCTVKDGRVTDVRLPRNVLARFQVLEYLRAFFVGRAGWSALDASLIISGAFGIFRRSVVVEVGGYHSDTVGEDMELVVRLHRHFREKRVPYRIHFVPDSVAWTACPETLLAFGRQRARWQCGLMESLWTHIRMLCNPSYGRIGLVAYPYFVFLDALGPVIEFLGYFAFAIALIFHRASALYFVAFLMLAVVFGATLSIASVALEELALRRYSRLSDLLRLFALAVTESFGYRQLMSYWRVHGLVSFLCGGRAWGKVKRTEFTTQKAI
jgi:cellulose synthase/poly-beta-1,6-N-acetylglucosamine synthase-like glycosyltransferase